MSLRAGRVRPEPLADSRDLQGLPGLREYVWVQLMHGLPTARVASSPRQDLETTRFLIKANLSAKDVAETYLPPFIGCAAAAGAAAVMSTYYAIQLSPSQADVSRCLCRHRSLDA